MKLHILATLLALLSLLQLNKTRYQPQSLALTQEQVPVNTSFTTQLSSSVPLVSQNPFMFITRTGKVGQPMAILLYTSDAFLSSCSSIFQYSQCSSKYGCHISVSDDQNSTNMSITSVHIAGEPATFKLDLLSEGNDGDSYWGGNLTGVYAQDCVGQWPSSTVVSGAFGLGASNPDRFHSDTKFSVYIGSNGNGELIFGYDWFKGKGSANMLEGADENWNVPTKGFMFGNDEEKLVSVGGKLVFDLLVDAIVFPYYAYSQFLDHLEQFHGVKCNSSSESANAICTGLTDDLPSVQILTQNNETISLSPSLYSKKTSKGIELQIIASSMNQTLGKEGPYMWVPEGFADRFIVGLDYLKENYVVFDFENSSEEKFIISVYSADHGFLNNIWTFIGTIVVILVIIVIGILVLRAQYLQRKKKKTETLGGRPVSFYQNFEA